MTTDPLHEIYPENSDLQPVPSSVDIIHQPQLKYGLNALMARLIDAHNLLSKSDLEMMQYNPISIELNYAKILLTEIINQL
jgi:hypothetical protein